MKNDCKIFALVVVKNEEDIIYDVIESATQWAEKIFIMDNMSTDTTWEKLKKISDKYDNVILWGQYGGKFNEGLRQILFKEYRHFASENDWWCRLDGDEFYIDDPRNFIRNINDRIDHIYNASFQFYLTEFDLDNEEKSKLLKVNSYKLLKWYSCNHSEIRFVKNKPTICWTQGEGWPCNLFKASDDRIRLKHFQYRSLEQIKNRFNIRSYDSIGDTFKHEIVSEEAWYKRRQFTIPKNENYRKYRIVDSTNLTNDESFEFSRVNLPDIVKVNSKKMLKCFFVAVFMKFFNNFTFKI